MSGAERNNDGVPMGEILEGARNGTNHLQLSPATNCDYAGTTKI